MGHRLARRLALGTFRLALGLTERRAHRIPPNLHDLALHWSYCPATLSNEQGAGTADPWGSGLTLAIVSGLVFTDEPAEIMAIGFDDGSMISEVR